MASPPAYQPTPPLTHRWPMTYLPTCSTVNSLYWWEEAALEALRTLHDFDEIKVIIRFTPGLDPTTAATVLSSRRKGWLDAFLNVLCRDDDVDNPPCDSLFSTATAVVAIIKQSSLSPALGWNGDWIFAALISSTDIRTVAEKFDTQIHSEVCTPGFEAWVAWCCGYQNDAISNFLDAVLSFRNDLARYVLRDAAMADALLSLQKASFQFGI